MQEGVVLRRAPPEMDSDKAHAKCAVCAVINHPDAAHHVYYGLHSMQHRGQESAGIVSLEPPINIRAVPINNSEKDTWKEDSFLEIFSDSDSRWHRGAVSAVESTCSPHMLTVRFALGAGDMKEKRVSRNSPLLREAADTTSPFSDSSSSPTGRSPTALKPPASGAASDGATHALATPQPQTALQLDSSSGSGGATETCNSSTLSPVNCRRVTSMTQLNELDDQAAPTGPRSTPNASPPATDVENHTTSGSDTGNADADTTPAQTNFERRFERQTLSPTHGRRRRKRGEMHCHKDNGLVLDVFAEEENLNKLRGNIAIGHNRYSTAGGHKGCSNIQPFFTTYKYGNIAIAHNGNICNYNEIRRGLIERGTLFGATSDTEMVLHMIAQSKRKTIREQVLEACTQLEGAFSMVILTDDHLFAVRDPNGFRPLVLGRMSMGPHKPPAWCVASETCAFDLIGATLVREIEPGELVDISMDVVLAQTGAGDATAFNSVKLPQRFGLSPCVFEHIYFARPDSMVFGQYVDTVRRYCGAQLAREAPIGRKLKPGEPVDPKTAAVVFAVPDSSNTAALGYAQECQRLGYNIVYEIGLIRNHYVGRTFIQPSQEARELKVRCKFNTVKRVIQDRECVMVDDSIVRGTTSKQLIRMVRNAGAQSVHFRVASPPVISPCYYGMDFPSREELLVNKLGGDANLVAQHLGADSVAYLSVDGLMKAVRRDTHNEQPYCTACFTGKYPIDIEEQCGADDYADLDW